MLVVIVSVFPPTIQAVYLLLDPNKQQLDFLQLDFYTSYYRITDTLSQIYKSETKEVLRTQSYSNPLTKRASL